MSNLVTLGVNLRLREYCPHIQQCAAVDFTTFTVTYESVLKDFSDGFSVIGECEYSEAALGSSGVGVDKGGSCASIGEGGDNGGSRCRGMGDSGKGENVDRICGIIVDAGGV
jgi:hypothetical protein